MATFTCSHFKRRCEFTAKPKNKILLMQAIKSKTSSNSNIANTEDSGTEIFLKASDDEDFCDEIYPEEPSERQILESFLPKKALMAVQHWYLPISLKIQTYSPYLSIGRLHMTSHISRQKKWLTKSCNLC